ncbi:MAG: M56 family metallopeptidase, partial [Planctomycetota bacterium]
MTAYWNRISDPWWAWMAPLFWQTALLMLFVLTIDHFLKRRGWPEVRLALWTLVFVRLLIPPSFTLPSSVSARALELGKTGLSALGRMSESTSLPVERGVANAGPFRVTEQGALPPATLFIRDANEQSASGLAPHSQRTPLSARDLPGPALSAKGWAMLVWALFSAVLAGWLVCFRAERLRRLARAGMAGEELPAWVRAPLQDAAARLRLQRLPRVVLTDAAGSAGVFGIARPVLLLPSALRSMPSEALEHVLLHETAHLKRGDLWMNAVQTLLHVLFWFHPAVWLAGRRLRHLREVCCDATVAAVLREHTPAYGRTLADAAAVLSSVKGRYALGFLGLFESSSRLRQRLEYLKRPGWKHARLHAASAAAVAALMLACVLPMAAPKAGEKDTAGQTVNAPSNPESLGRIAGHVRDSAGRPVAQANIRYGSENGQPRGSWKAVTDETGFYSLADILPGREYWCVVTKEGFLDTHNSFKIPEDTGVLTIDIALKPLLHTEISGVVVDEKGAPVAGALVEWSYKGEGHYQTTQTDDAGAFRLGPLTTSGAQYLYVEKEGYAYSALPVDLMGKKETDNLRITLEPGYSISGVVVDEDGKPIPGATVQPSLDSSLQSLEERRPLFSVVQTWTRTLPEGRFEVKAMPKGEYRLWVQCEGINPTLSEPISTGTTDARIVIRKGVPLGGKVVDDATGLPVTAFTLRMTEVKRGDQYVTYPDLYKLQLSGRDFQDDQGRFAFEDFPPDAQCTLVASAPGYTYSDRQIAAPGKPVEIRLQKGREVAVHVTDKVTGADITNAKVRFYCLKMGERHPGSPDEFIRAPGAPFLQSYYFPPVTAGEMPGGRYEFSGAGPSSQWLLEVTAEGYSPAMIGYDKGGVPASVEIRLPHGTSVDGLFKPLDDMAPEDSRIRCRQGNIVFMEDIQEDGTFRLKDVPVGRLTATLLMDAKNERDPQPINFPVEVKYGKDMNLTIDLSEFYQVEGRVLANGKPLAYCTVGAWSEDRSVSCGALTDAEGRYRLFLKTPGQYRVAAWTYPLNSQIDDNIKYARDGMDCEVKDLRQVLDIPLSGILSGTVAREDGEPLTSFTISTWRDDQGKPSFWERCHEPDSMWATLGYHHYKAGDRFCEAPFEPGTYLLQASRSFSGTDWSVQQKVRRTVTLDKDNLEIGGLRMVFPALPPTGGLDIAPVDAETGEPLLRSVLVEVKNDSIKSEAWKNVVGNTFSLPDLPAGRYTLVIAVGEPGYPGLRDYQTVSLPNVEIRANERQTLRVPFKRAGMLRVTLRFVPPAPNYGKPHMIFVWKNGSTGPILLQLPHLGVAPNVAIPLSPVLTGETEMACSVGGIPPGEHSVTLYWMRYETDNPDADPKGRFDLHFTVEAGKTTT